MDDYYATEEITLQVHYRIKWNADNIKARDDALRLAMSLCPSAGGAGLNGCYGAQRISQPTLIKHKALDAGGE